MKRILTLFLLALVVMLFQNNIWVKLTLVWPAYLTFPQHIKTLVIVDRTEQSETMESKIEQTLSGEFLEQDEQAIAKLIEGTVNLCSGTQRFNIIRTGERSIGGGTKNTFPSPLSWTEVTKHCQKHNADAVMSIEIFDSDFIITSNPFQEEVKGKDGVVSQVTKYMATGVTVLNIGIRIYDPKTKKIFDEYRVTERFNTEASAVNAQDAVNSLLDKVEAINRTSYNVGYAYGKRISPYYYTVKREFYDKPKKSKYLQEGARKSEVSDWEGAIESWLKVFESKNKKDVKAYGKAAFNIAVAYEVLGNLEKAKEWASKSYTVYEDKEASDYYKALKKRERNEAVVQNQMP